MSEIPVVDHVAGSAAAESGTPAVSVRARQLALLYAQLPFATTGVAVTSIALCAFFWPQVSQRDALAWLGGLGVLTGLRLLGLRHYYSARARWPLWALEAVFLGGVVLSGAFWGAAPLLFHHALNTEGQLVLGIATTGMVAAGLSTLSPRALAFAAFAVPAMGSYAWALWRAGGSGSELIAALALVYAALMILISRRYERTLIDSIVLRSANQDLAQNLERVGSLLGGERRERDRLRGMAEAAAQRLQLYVKQTPLAVIEWDPEFRVLDWNPAAERIFGYARTEVLGRYGPELVVPPEAREAVAGIWEQLLLGQGGRRSTNPNITGDGRTIQCEWYNTPLVDGTGCVVGVTSLAQDVTEQYEAAQRLVVAGHVFDHTSAGIVVTGADGRITAVNRAFTAITGYAPDEVVGRSTSMLQSGRHGAEFFEALWHSVNTAGHWSGEIWNRRKDGTVFAEILNINTIRDEAGKLLGYVGSFSDITRLKETQEQLELLANYDLLTGLPNRHRFQERVREAIVRAEQGPGSFALLYADLDDFKIINDTLGHDTGDQLLKRVAAELQRVVRHDDMVARIGGDEFTLLLTGANEATATRTAERIRAALARPFSVGGHDVFANVSLGIVLYPGDGADLPTLLKNADTAMYRAKEQGRNHFAFFRPEMGVAAGERLLMENRLRYALERSEFVLHYQPFIDLQSGHITGCEALLRWNQPEWGMVPPDRFIGAAEHCGLIVPIGAFVLLQACQQLAAWGHSVAPDFRMAVNVSARQLRDPGFFGYVTEAVHRAGIRPTQLELEVTESAVMQDPAQVAELLTRLRDFGVEIAMDDFGTGYSSLSYLRRLPINRLKIDRSFLPAEGASSDQVAVISAIIRMADALNLRVTAEGVETEAHATLLRAEGCREAQGYLFARPAAAEVVEARLVRVAYPVPQPGGPNLKPPAQGVS